MRRDVEKTFHMRSWSSCCLDERSFTISRLFITHFIVQSDPCGENTDLDGSGFLHSNALLMSIVLLEHSARDCKHVLISLNRSASFFAFMQFGFIFCISFLYCAVIPLMLTIGTLINRDGSDRSAFGFTKDSHLRLNHGRIF